MLLNEPCNNVRYTHRETHEVEIYKIGNTSDNVDDFGTISGCAIYFKENSEYQECIIATGTYSNHGHITTYLSDVEGFDINLLDDENTCYGFITNKGYFLNRELALLAYRKFCKDNKMTAPIKDAVKLYSYSVSWSAVCYALNSNILGLVPK